MATFVIETYLSRARRTDLDLAVVALRRAAAAASDAVARCRHLRSFYVEADEIAYHLIEASTLQVAERVGRAAGLNPDRIVSAESPDPAAARGGSGQP